MCYRPNPPVIRLESCTVVRGCGPVLGPQGWSGRSVETRRQSPASGTSVETYSTSPTSNIGAVSKTSAALSLS